VESEFELQPIRLQMLHVVFCSVCLNYKQVRRFKLLWDTYDTYNQYTRAVYKACYGYMHISGTYSGVRMDVDRQS